MPQKQIQLTVFKILVLLELFNSCLFDYFLSSSLSSFYLSCGFKRPAADLCNWLVEMQWWIIYAWWICRVKMAQSWCRFGGTCLTVITWFKWLFIFILYFLEIRLLWYLVRMSRELTNWPRATALTTLNAICIHQFQTSLKTLQTAFEYIDQLTHF